MTKAPTSIRSRITSTRTRPSSPACWRRPIRSASGLSTHIFSAKQAFMVLGASTASSTSSWPPRLTYRYDMRSYRLRRPPAVAPLARRRASVRAQVLAELRSAFNPEMAFTGGLLHDIGQLLMFVPPVRRTYVQRARPAPPSKTICRLIAAERSGLRLRPLGGRVRRAGAMPGNCRPKIVDAIAAHHEPDEMFSEIGNLVHVSEILSHAPRPRRTARTTRFPSSPELASANLGLSRPKLAPHFAEIEARYDGLRIALGL